MVRGGEACAYSLGWQFGVYLFKKYVPRTNLPNDMLVVKSEDGVWVAMAALMIIRNQYSLKKLYSEP